MNVMYKLFENKDCDLKFPSIFCALASIQQAVNKFNDWL